MGAMIASGPRRSAIEGVTPQQTTLGRNCITDIADW